MSRAVDQLLDFVGDYDDPAERFVGTRDSVLSMCAMAGLSPAKGAAIVLRYACPESGLVFVNGERAPVRRPGAVERGAIAELLHRTVGSDEFSGETTLWIVAERCRCSRCPLRCGEVVERVVVDRGVGGHLADARPGSSIRKARRF